MCALMKMSLYMYEQVDHSRCGHCLQVEQFHLSPLQLQHISKTFGRPKQSHLPPQPTMMFMGFIFLAGLLDNLCVATRDESKSASNQWDPLIEIFSIAEFFRRVKK